MDASRKWLPCQWLDETVPRCESTPDAFISREGDGWRLRPPEGSPDRHDDRDVDPDRDPYNEALEPGQIVQFCWTEDFGLHEVTVHPDGSWTCPTTWPDTATHFWVPFDPDTLAGSMDTLVAGNDFVEGLDTGEHTIGVYFWSDAVPLRLDVGADGQARFVPCAGVS